MIDQRTWPLRVCEACLSDRYEVNDSVAKTFVCTDCGHESKTVRTLTVVAVEDGCCCGNGEAEEDRSAVLRCPVHGSPNPGGMAASGRDVEEAARETIARAYEDSWGAAQGLGGGKALYLDPDDFGAFVAKALRVAGLLRDQQSDGRDG